MFRCIQALLCTLVLVGQDPQTSRPAQTSPETQPATRRAGDAGPLPKPAQAEILKSLLGREDRPTPIRPQESTAPSGTEQPSAGVDPEGQPLLLEGTILVERPGRLVHEGGRAKFVFHLDGGSETPRQMEILQNQLLEAMQREAESGFTEFIVSAEVTRYRDRNFLLLRKILRRANHGNLGP